MARTLGVDKTSVRDWDRQGWIVRLPDRSIDLDATIRLVNASKDPSRGGRKDRGIGAEPLMHSSTCDTGSAPPDDPPDDLRLPDGMTSAKARTLKDYWNAVKAEQEARVAARENGPVAAFEEVYVDAITKAKASFEALPVRAAPKLVGLTSEVEIRAVLDAEVERVLRGLSDVPPAVAAE